MTITSQVYWLDAPRQLSLRQETLTGPAVDQILCKTLVSAISPGTEIAAWTGLPHLRPDVRFPRLMGYCNVSVVEAVGSDMSDYQVGDRVLSFTSHRTHALLRRSDILMKLLPSHDAGAIACTYLFHLGYDAIMRSDVRPGSRVLVIGMGALGLTTVALARQAGASVAALTNQAINGQRAEAMGADRIFDRSNITTLRDHWNGNGADVVISTSNKWDDWHIALEAAAQFGTIACLGFPGRGEPPPAFNPLATEFFHAKQLRIESVGMPPSRLDTRGLLRFSEKENIAWLAGMIGENRIDPSVLISAQYPAVELERAYVDLAARKDSPITYLLKW